MFTTNAEKPKKPAGAERVPRRVIQIVAVAVFVAGGLFGVLLRGDAGAVTAYWFCYALAAVAVFLRRPLRYSMGTVHLLQAWPRCDQCGGLAQPLSRTPVERQMQLLTWSCRAGQVFHTPDRLPLLPRTREIHAVRDADTIASE